LLFVSTINRTAPSWFFGSIVGAEYLLRLVPAGTPSTPVRAAGPSWRSMVRAVGLTLCDMTVIEFTTH